MSDTQTKLVCITIVILAAFLGVSQYQSRQIEKEKAIAEAKIEQEKAAIHEKEETERTEERSQFWQKAVPWGKDEDEQGQTTETK